jgi:hypothetical protein
VFRLHRCTFSPFNLVGAGFTTLIAVIDDYLCLDIAKRIVLKTEQAFQIAT